MPLDADAMVDRRRLKRSLALWRGLAVLLGALALVAVIGRLVDRGDDHVARITVSGLIVEDRQRDRALARAMDDASVKAVLVVVNSPGGTLVGGEALYKRLREVAAKKPVVASLGTLATSAGYMVALGADHIVAHEGTITASVGVVFQATDLTALLERMGVKVDTIKSGPLKAAPNPFEKTTPETRAAIDALVKDAMALFLGLVRERRGLSEAEAQAIADGRVVSGRQARTLRLIDALGGENEARDWLERERRVARTLPVRSIDPARRWTLSRALAGLFGVRDELGEWLALDGLVSLWHPALR
jgi:protease-4